MVSTRSSTGHSKPRIQLNIDTQPERKQKTTNTTKTYGSPHRSAVSGVKKNKTPATHHKRKPLLKDKIEGAVEKLEGKLTRRPGKKAAGTRKMRGTDGKGSHRRV
ncbi:hypothetical protein M426DRAFT_21381 [Hypoxylon sp. CI-4A]|nr:hypothetical protein M426DRAFT_21381 [Hypoxylon sp. CI-4A]